MKTLLTIILSIVFVVPVFGENGIPAPIVEKEKAKGAYCPVTTFTDQGICYDCHEIRQVDGKWKWVIKPQDQTDPKGIYRHKNWVRIDNGEPYGYYEISGEMYSAAFEIFVEYVYQMGFKKVTVDISSGGGSLIEGWAICSMIQQMGSRGIEVTTQVRSYAASAAFLILVAGEKRLVEKTAYLMTHELWTLAWLKLETPSSKEDEAVTMRMFQNVIHEWLAERSKLTVDELDKRVRHKDWWMSGKAAVEEWGFADGYIK